MAGASRSTIEALLKDTYHDPIVELLNQRNFLISRIGEDTDSFVGNRAVLPLHVGRNQGIGARPEYDGTAGAEVPTPGNQEYDNAYYDVTHLYGTIRITGPSIARSESDEGSFGRILETEVMGIANDLARDVNRQLFGPKAGTLAKVSSISSAASGQIVVDSNQFMRKNMKVDIVDSSTYAVKHTVVVNTFVRSTKTATLYSGGSPKDLTSGLGIAANDLIVRHGSYGIELWGLQDLISSSNPASLPSSFTEINRYVGGIDRTTAEHWRSTEVDKGGDEFAPQFFQDMIDEVEIESDGSPSLFLTTYAIFNRYANGMLQDKRYYPSDGKGGKIDKLDAGRDMLEYNGIPVAKDRDNPEGVIYGLDESTLTMFTMADWDWMDDDGAILSRVKGINGTADAYEGVMYCYKQMGIDAPNKNSVYKNVSAST